MIVEQENLLEYGEQMILPVRKHWFVYVESVFIHMVGGGFLLISANILAKKDILGGVYRVETELSAMVLAGFALIVWTSLFYAWTKLYFDVWYVTDKHIIAINQRQIFDRDESFMEIERVQDVSFEKQGFLSNVFGFGRLKVQSAGTEREFVMDTVADVEHVVRKILELRDDAQGV